MKKITPFLWFDDAAEQAANFYVSIFNNSEIVKVTHYESTGAQVSGRPAGSVMTVVFRIEGQTFIALNGGPQFSFSPAISFMVDCVDQQEVDQLWERLAEGGEIQQCGWLTDKFGVTWQIVPSALEELFQDSDPEQSERVMKALLQMHKIDIAALQQARQSA